MAFISIKWFLKITWTQNMMVEAPNCNKISWNKYLFLEIEINSNKYT